MPELSASEQIEHAHLGYLKLFKFGLCSSRLILYVHLNEQVYYSILHNPGIRNTRISLSNYHAKCCVDYNSLLEYVYTKRGIFRGQTSTFQLKLYNLYNYVFILYLKLNWIA